MNLWAFNFIWLYILAIFIISLYFVKKAVYSYEEYSLCGRSLTYFYMVITYLSTWIGGGSIIALVTLSYLSGVSQYWLVSMPCLIGFSFAFLFITRIRTIRQYSIGDMLGIRFPDYKEIIRIPTAFALIIRNVTVIGMQFSATALFISYIFKLDYNLACLFTFLVITAYTALSGLWGIVATDLLQGFLQATGLLVLLYQSIKSSGGWDKVYDFYLSTNHSDFLTLVSGTNWWNEIGIYISTIGLFFLMSDQGDWQRINSCKSDKVAFWSYLTPLCVTLLWLLIPAYVGVVQRVILSPAIPSQYAFFQFITGSFSVSVAGFVLVCLLAAITSSADSFLLSTGLTFSRDIVKPFINPAASDKELIFWSRFFTLVAGGIGFAFAIIGKDLIGLWILGLTISSSIVLVPYLFAWFSKRINTNGALAGMLSGGLLCAFFLLFSDKFNLCYLWLIFGINALVCVTFSYMSKPPESADVSKTYYWSPVFKDIKNIP